MRYLECYNRYTYLPKLFKILKYIKKPILISVIKTYLRFPFIIKNLINLISENKKISQLENKLTKLIKILERSNNLVDIYFETIKTNNTKYFNYKNKSLNDIRLSDQSDLMYLDKINYLQNDILCKVDRATMSASLESRAPF